MRIVDHLQLRKEITRSITPDANCKNKYIAYAQSMSTQTKVITSKNFSNPIHTSICRIKLLFLLLETQIIEFI